MKIRKGQRVGIDWPLLAESFNNVMVRNNPGLYDRCQEIMSHAGSGSTALVTGTWDRGSHIYLKCTDGFEFGCSARFLAPIVKKR